MLRTKTPSPRAFRSGQQFATWIGLAPRDHSTTGKIRLGVITRADDEALRRLLVVGATAIVRRVRERQCGWELTAWGKELLQRKPLKLVAVALANSWARIAWKMMVTGETYVGSIASPASVKR